MLSLTILINFLLFALASAAPTFHVESTNWQGPTGGGVIGFIVLVLDIIVFLEIIKSNRPTSHKLLWCLGVFFFPVVGLIVYYLFSNRQAHNSGSGYEPITN